MCVKKLKADSILMFFKPSIVVFLKKKQVTHLQV